jgi:hypothetical protein
VCTFIRNSDNSRTTNLESPLPTKRPEAWMESQSHASSRVSLGRFAEQLNSTVEDAVSNLVVRRLRSHLYFPDNLPMVLNLALLNDENLLKRLMLPLSTGKNSINQLSKIPLGAIVFIPRFGGFFHVIFLMSCPVCVAISIPIILSIVCPHSLLAVECCVSPVLRFACRPRSFLTAPPPITPLLSQCMHAPPRPDALLTMFTAI